MNFEQAIEFFVATMKKKGRSDNTIKNYVSDLNTFEKFIGVHGGDGVVFAPQKAIRKYTQQIEKSGLAKSTVNRRIQSLRTFYATLIEAGIRKDNPMEEVKSKSIAKQNDIKWLERHQVRAIFESIDNIQQSDSKRIQQRAIMSIFVNCGLRAQELCDLKMDDINWEHRIFSVIGKGGKFRKVPFTIATERAMLRWLQYRDGKGEYLFHSERSPQMTTRAIQHMVKKISETLDFKFTVHQLRHTALKRIADTTGKIEIVATIAGHENVNTSRIYIEPSLAEIGEAMKKSEYDF